MGGLKVVLNEANGQPEDIKTNVKFYTNKFIMQGWVESSSADCTAKGGRIEG